MGSLPKINVNESGNLEAFVVGLLLLEIKYTIRQRKQEHELLLQHVSFTDRALCLTYFGKLIARIVRVLP